MLNKIKNNINLDLIKKFDKNIMEKLCFIPFNEKNEVIFVLIHDLNCKIDAAKEVKFITQKSSKFIQISLNDFHETWNFIFSENNSEIEIIDKPKVKETTIEELKINKKAVQEELEGFNINLDINNFDDNSINIKIEKKTEEKSVDILGELPTISPLEELEEFLPLENKISPEIDDFANSLQHIAPATQYVAPQETPEIKQPKKGNKAEEKNKEIAPKHTTGDVSKEKVGQILVEWGYITNEQLIKALAQSKKDQAPLGSTLYKMNYITLNQLKEVLHEQKGLDVVKTEQLNIQEKVLNILPEDFIKTNKVIPLSSDGKTLTIGAVNAENKKVLKDIVYLTGQKVNVLMITHVEFQNCLDNFYGGSKKETQEIIQQIEDESLELELEETLWEQVERELAESTGSVAKFVNKIITDAIDSHSSDIHIEPRLANYVVRYRTYGMLKQIVEIPNKVEQSVITRFKVLARLNIAEHRRPQDGTFTLKYKGNSYDFRINTLPVSGKEKIVIRVLAPAVSLSSNDRNIELVGCFPEDIAKIKKMISCPNGIILTSGPTGSGKTTTLYSILKSLNTEDVNITTIEDPIEIKLEGINQSQVNAKAGITFASCMRAILRQDPDIILVGEIRDYETLEVAISAALTGHLVLSTVHTNSAAATVTRLVEMGAKDYLVASTMSGVLAQRLVRQLCPKCKEAYNPTKEEAESLFLNEEDRTNFMKETIYKAKGCNDCDYTGYKGRFGLYEVMMITKEIRKMIASGAHDLEIEEAAIENGMTNLNQACIKHIKEGSTSVSEFIRVLGVVSE